MKPKANRSAGRTSGAKVKPHAAPHEPKRRATSGSTHFEAPKGTANTMEDSKLKYSKTNVRTETNGHAAVDPAADGPAIAQANLPPIKTQSGVELTEKIKELLRLAQEQGYLTYNDINDALPDNIVTPEDLDEIYIKLRSLDVEIVDQAEVDRVKQPEPEEEEDKSRMDILDDPV